MPFRIEVQYKVPDARSVSKCGFFNTSGLSGKVKKVEILDCYTVDSKLSPKQMEAAAKLLTNPETENYNLSTRYTLHATRFDFAIEIAYLPGVTDNIGNTAKETIADGLKYKFKAGENVYSSQIFFIKFQASSNNKNIGADIQKIANSLYNPLIQHAKIKSAAQFKKDRGMGLNLPKVNLHFKPKATEVHPVKSPKGESAFGGLFNRVNLYVNDEELERLGKLGIPDTVIAKERKRLKQTVLDPSLRSGRPIGRIASDALAMTKRRGPLALSLEDLKTIRNYFHKLQRNPTDVELEALAQTWSEHCKHTIFADPLDEIKDGIYRHYIKRATDIVRAKSRTKNADICVSVFKDNSGGIIFDNNYLITHKVETHNSPSALDPFGGSVTGIGGVNRDALGFGLGAKPVINTYGFCLSAPDDKTMLYRDAEKTNPMLSARRIMDGVVAGINAGGNQSGIPTNSGFMYFDSRYRGKPLVFAGTVGLIPRKINGKPSHIKQAKPGDLIVTIGGRVGLDGIHGATFASETLHKDSPAAAVQIGDPITQKKFSDAIVREARDKGLYNSITDCGAGGLSSAVGEMAAQAAGFLVNLDKVPAKYPGLAPWQIWISESQERMVLSVPLKKWKQLESLIKKRGVEASVIGKFTADGKCILKYKNQTVMDMDMNFLHDGRPVKFQQSDASNPRSVSSRPNPNASEGEWRDPLMSMLSDSSTRMHSLGMTAKDKNTTNLKSLILNLLSRPSIASRAFLATQYDHEVQGGSVTKPLQGKGRVDAEATVTRPVLSSNKGVVLSYGLYPEYSETDPYKMAGAAIDTAVRSAVSAGADINHLALLDNFCWPEGNDPYRLWQLKKAARACFDYAVAFGTPFISGKDSMFNDFKGFDIEGQPIKISIPPTLLISTIGVMDDISKAITMDAKMPGDLVYLLGETKDELGGSEYERMNEELENRDKRIGNRIGNKKSGVPHTNAKKNLKLYLALQNAIEKELVASAIPLTRGGLAVALCKTSIAGQLGLNVNLTNIKSAISPFDKLRAGNQKSEILFSESQGRILVTLNPKNARKFEKLMKGNKIYKLGTITEDKTITLQHRSEKIEIPLSQATNAYHSTFKNF